MPLGIPERHSRQRVPTREKLRSGMDNPVLRRELKNAIGSPKVFLIRLAFVGVLSLLVLWRWTQFAAEVEAAASGPASSAANPYYGGPGGMRGPAAGGILAAVPQGARELFSFVCVAELFLLIALVPPLAAGLIAEEKERRTLEMLLATPMKPWHIVKGKLVGSLQGALILILCSAPVIMAIILMGGVSPLEVLGVLVVLAASAFAIAATCMLASALSGRGFYATLVSYFVLFGAWGGLYVIASVAAAFMPRAIMGGGAWNPLQYVHGAVNPWACLSLVLSEGPWIAAPFAVLALLAGGFFTVLATWCVSRMQPAAPSAMKGTRVYRWLSSRPTAKRGQPEYRWLADWTSNPVMARDLRGRIISIADTIVRVSYVGVILTELMVPLYWDPGPAAAVLCFWIAVFALLGGVIGATSIASEHERDTFELMRSTPLTAAQIVTGKIGAGLAKLQLVIILSLPAALFAVACGGLPPLAIVIHLAASEVAALVGACVGAFFSAVMRRVSRAVIATLLTLAVAVLLDSICAGALSPAYKPLLPAVSRGERGVLHDALTGVHPDPSWTGARSPRTPPGSHRPGAAATARTLPAAAQLLVWLAVLVVTAAALWLATALIVRYSPLSRRQ